MVKVAITAANNMLFTIFLPFSGSRKSGRKQHLDQAAALASLPAKAGLSGLRQ
jgi:hypothetical protein